VTGREAPLVERITEKIAVTTDGCWLWQGYRDRSGYGRVYGGPDIGKVMLVHRAVYMLAVGDLDPNLTIDHLCRVRSCCNPLHLEQVTQRENSLRGESPNIVLYRSGRCRHGHDLAVHGARRTPKRQSVYCRLCRNEQRRAQWAARTRA
jgi:hypothetical protein